MKNPSFENSIVVLLTWVLAAGFFAAHHEAGAGDFGDPYFLVEKTYGLDPRVDERRLTRRNVGYLPPGLLVFRDPKQLIVTIAGKKWRSVITQHGERLMIRDAATDKFLSKKTFRRTYGTRNIIFHRDHYLCPKDDISCDESTGIDIAKGSVASSKEAGWAVAFTYDKSAQDGTRSERKGFLEKNKFLSFQNSGILTDANRRHPRYRVKRLIKYDSLSTGCGDIKTEVDANQLKTELAASMEAGVGVEGGLWKLISGVFKLNISLSSGKTWKNSNTVTSRFGANGNATRHYSLHLTDFQADGGKQERVFYVSAVIACTGTVESLRIPIVIRSLQVVTKTGALVALLKFSDFYPRETLNNDISNNQKVLDISKNISSRLFLTSITSRHDYHRILRIWASKASGWGVSLAHILMTSFNATCPGSKNANGIKKRQICNRLVKTMY